MINRNFIIKRISIFFAQFRTWNVFMRSYTLWKRSHKYLYNRTRTSMAFKYMYTHRKQVMHEICKSQTSGNNPNICILCRVLMPSLVQNSHAFKSPKSFVGASPFARYLAAISSAKSSCIGEKEALSQTDNHLSVKDHSNLKGSLALAKHMLIVREKHISQSQKCKTCGFYH